MKVHANRCEQFLANPKLKDLLVKRKISFSKNDTARASGNHSGSDKSESRRSSISPVVTPKETPKPTRVQRRKSVISKVKMETFASSNDSTYQEQDSISLNGNLEESSVIENELTSEQF